jgi:hypothetical protein
VKRWPPQPATKREIRGNFRDTAARRERCRPVSPVNPNGVNLEELLLALARKGIPLQHEMGAFVVLEATEKVVAMQAGDRTQRPPPRVLPAAVWLSDEGELAIAEVGPAASEREACAALVELLGALLVRSAPGVPAMLLELVEQGPSDGEWTLRRLRDDLEASLLPLNRGATRRVLSRLLREVRRDVERGGKSATPAPDLHTVDRALDDLLGVQPDQLPPVPLAAALEPSGAIDVTSLAETVRPGPRVPLAGQIVPPVAQRERAAAREPARAEPVRAEPARPPALYRDEPAPERPKPRADGEPPALRRREATSVAGESNGNAPALRGGASSPSAWERVTDTLTGARSPRDGLDEFDSHASGEGRSGSKVALLLGAAAVLLVLAYFVLGRNQGQHALGSDQPKAAGADQSSAGPAAPHAGAKRFGTLTVTSTPPKAQVLMLVGSGPALIKDLPVGMAHEFVAMADGLAPARGLVPPGASWASDGAPEDGAPRYELAVQLADAVGGGLDLGPSRLTQGVGTATGALGSVRVVTSPPGARVYQLIGFTPDVRVENLPVDAPVDLLVFASGYALQRASVGPGDWKPEGGTLAATVDVALTRKGR